MTTVPGTYFTKEQLEAVLKGNNYFLFLHPHSNQANELVYKVDKISAGGYSGSDIMKQIGLVYDTEKKQHDKALAWYILAAMENNSRIQNNIGVLYYHGNGVPKNYLCALKWYLKSTQGNDNPNTATYIGLLFEYGYGVPLDKYKALE
jgi:TPR repeat protein